MTMIWGMTLEPGKLYTETMGEEVQLSMAAIDSRKDLGESSNTNFCQIVIQTEKGEYVLCTLVHGVMFQQSLDLKLMPRERVTFSVQGPSVVYLVGYTASYPEDEELDMQPEDYGVDEDSSAWETIEEGDQPIDQIKQEPVEVLDDSDTDIDSDHKEAVQGEIAALQEPVQGEIAALQEPTKSAVTEELPKESEQGMIFSVAEIDPQPVVKEEAVEPPDSSVVMTPSQLPPHEEHYGIQHTDHGISLPSQTSTSQEFFYPESQQQPDVGLTPPVAFQPINSGPDFQQQHPQGGVLPPAETFLQQTQKPFMQRSHPGPIRQPSPMGSRQSVNTQRTYPQPRRQYGTNRNQPAGKTRSAPQPMNVQQMRNLSNVPSHPGPSQQDIPGPSSSGIMGDIALAPRYLIHPSERKATKPGENPSSPGSNRPRGREGPRPFAKSDALPPGGEFCRKCGKYIENLARLRAHEKYHDRLGRYQCRFCEKPFGATQDLKRHERSHTGEKPFNCTVCGRGFNRSDRMRRHMTNAHPSANQ